MINSDVRFNGEFKFEIYDSNNKLLKTIIQSNFITNTGIKYLQTLAFADCFRYLSLGSGTAQNSIQNGSDTTGLNIFLPNFAYIGPVNNGYAQNTCGYTETCSGINLQKGWIVPPVGTFFDGDYNFKEFMLTPAITGDSCSLEYEDFSLTYPNICNYTKAFTRVIPNPSINVSKNNYMIVYYNLNIVTNTGLNSFSIPIKRDGAVGDSTNWVNGITGFYNIVHHGLKLVNPNGLYNFNTIFQPFNPGESICDSINSPLGSPMEPSCNTNNLFFYLTTDNTQFLVSPMTGGAIDTSLYYPFNTMGLPFPSGTEYYQCYPTQSYFLNGNNVPYWLVNTRQGGNGQTIYPCNPTFDTDCVDVNTEFWASNSLLSVTPGTFSYINKGRTGVKTMQISIPGTQILGSLMQNQPVKSMVFAYTGNGNGNSYPFIDFIIQSQQGHLPFIDTVDLSFSEGTNTYNYLDGDNNFSISFTQTFSSPCDHSSVLGC